MSSKLKIIVIIAIIVGAICFILVKQTKESKQPQGIEESLQNAKQIMEQESKSIFNKQFVEYEGNQTGVEIRNLISRVMTNNVSKSDDMLVSVNNKKTSTELSALRASVLKEKTYNVKITYNNKGIVSEITFEML